VLQQATPEGKDSLATRRFRGNFMIGVLLHLAGVDGASLGACAVLVVIASVFCCCCYAKGGCRACRCGKGFLRCIGWDKYADAEVFFVVKTAKFVSVDKIETCVKLTAGGFTVQTFADSSGTFHEVLSLFIAQGTEDVEVELLEHWNGRVLAKSRLDVGRDIFEKCGCGRYFSGDSGVPVDRTLFLKPEQNRVAQPKVDVSIQMHSESEGNDDLHIDMEGISPETQVLVKMQLSSAAGPKPSTEIEAFVRAFAGPVEEIGMFGWNSKRYLGVLGPPSAKKYVLCKWDSEEEGKDGRPPKVEISLLRIVGVQPDPRVPKGFLVNHVTKDKSRHQEQFSATERSRDVWVELLSAIIERVRKERNEHV